MKSNRKTLETREQTKKTSDNSFTFIKLITKCDARKLLQCRNSDVAALLEEYYVFPLIRTEAVVLYNATEVCIVAKILVECRSKKNETDV